MKSIMQFNFTPEQILKGEVNYDFPSFRRDLKKEVRKYIEEKKPEESEKNKRVVTRILLNLYFDVFYWTALGNELPELLDFLKKENPNANVDMLLLEGLREEGKEAIPVLRAIFRKKMEEYTKTGISIEQAFENLKNYIQDCLVSELKEEIELEKKEEENKN